MGEQGHGFGVVERVGWGVGGRWVGVGERVGGMGRRWDFGEDLRNCGRCGEGRAGR